MKNKIKYSSILGLVMPMFVTACDKPKDEDDDAEHQKGIKKKIAEYKRLKAKSTRSAEENKTFAELEIELVREKEKREDKDPKDLSEGERNLLKELQNLRIIRKTTTKPSNTQNSETCSTGEGSASAAGQGTQQNPGIGPASDHVTSDGGDNETSSLEGEDANQEDDEEVNLEYDSEDKKDEAAPAETPEVPEGDDAAVGEHKATSAETPEAEKDGGDKYVNQLKGIENEIENISTTKNIVCANQIIADIENFFASYKKNSRMHYVNYLRLYKYLLTVLSPIGIENCNKYIESTVWSPDTKAQDILIKINYIVFTIGQKISGSLKFQSSICKTASDAKDLVFRNNTANKMSKAISSAIKSIDGDIQQIQNPTKTKP